LTPAPRRGRSALPQDAVSTRRSRSAFKLGCARYLAAVSGWGIKGKIQSRPCPAGRGSCSSLQSGSVRGALKKPVPFWNGLPNSIRKRNTSSVRSRECRTHRKSRDLA
jgi:hypothetical protein